MISSSDLYKETQRKSNFYRFAYRADGGKIVMLDEAPLKVRVRMTYVQYLLYPQLILMEVERSSMVGATMEMIVNQLVLNTTVQNGSIS
jgi:hypothetical protein